MDSAKEKKQKEMHHEIQHEDLDEHEPYRYHDVKTILSWKAPGRPYKKRTKEFLGRISTLYGKD